MEPSEPPLKDRNPVMRIIAPIPNSCMVGGGGGAKKSVLRHLYAGRKK
jgi:hypothetical protein